MATRFCKLWEPQNYIFMNIPGRNGALFILSPTVFFIHSRALIPMKGSGLMSNDSACTPSSHAHAASIQSMGDHSGSMSS